MSLHSRLRHLAALAAVAAAVAVTPALAHAELGVTFTAPGTRFEVFPGGIVTLGYAFTVLSPTTIIGLAIYDAEKDGLIEPHTVGLWESDGTLLVSATLAAGSSAPLVDFFRMTDTDPIALTVGQQYLVASTSVEGDPYTHFTTGFAVNPKIRFDHDAVEIGASLTFPGQTDHITVSEGGGFFGGNVVIAQATAPEPATFVLVAGGLALVGVAARRRAARY